MMISTQKVSLCYFAVCLAIATTAVGVLTHANAADLSLPDDLPAPVAVVDAAGDRPIAAPKPLTPMQQAAAAFQTGETARGLGQASEALTAYAAALAISQDAGNRQYEGMIWQRIAKTYGAAHDDQQAEIYGKKAIALAEETHDVVVLGEAQADLAQIYDRQGDRQRALPLYRQALANLRQVGDRLTAQAVEVRAEKIASTLKPKPAPKVAVKSPVKVPAVKVAIVPESIVLPPERIESSSIELVSDDVTQDPEPPIGGGASIGQ
jgi:tetratricopeptide (TPR) repeat protein